MCVASAFFRKLRQENKTYPDLTKTVGTGTGIVELRHSHTARVASRAGNLIRK